MRKIRFLLPLFFALSFLTSCAFFASFDDSSDRSTGNLFFDSTSMTLATGEMGVLNLKASKNQGSASITWSYDESVVSAKHDNYGIVITGVAAGQATIKATNGSDSAVCIVTVTSDIYTPTVENPYVYASEDYVSLTPGDTHKIYASVYGGTNNTAGFSWSIDKPSIASISTEGNYCWITGISSGTAKLTVRNSSVSTYGYSVLVGVSSDGTAVPYITTDSNIISINMSEEKTADFSVSLKNPSSESYDKTFACSIVDSDGSTLADSPITVTASGTDFHIQATATGQAVIRITHAESIYPLDVLVRVGVNASLTYINLSETTVTLTSDTPQSVTASLVNTADGVTDDPSLYKWTASSDASDYVSWYFTGSDDDTTGNEIILTAKANGIAKFTVSYPSAASSPRSFIVVVRNLTSTASDATTYITTSQNYVKTAVGDGDTTVYVTLNNTSEGKEDELQWNIVNTAADGSSDPVIKYVSGTGTSTSTSSARSAIALTYNATGNAVIKPLRAGTATITLSHPDAIYDTKILVKVLASASSDTSPYVLSSDTSLVSLTSGSSKTVTVTLSGTGKTDSDDNAITWSSSDSNVTVAGNGTTGVVSFTGTAGGSCFINVNHAKAGNVLKIPVIYAEDAESLSSVKCLYAPGDVYFTIYTGNTAVLNLAATGLSDTDTVSWNVTSGLNSVISYSQTTSYAAVVTGLAKGAAVVTASCNGAGSVTYYINVKDSSVIDDSADCYLTTTNNVVYFSSVNSTSDITVTPINIASSAYSSLSWSLSDSSAFSVTANGASTTVTALKDNSEAVLTVSHPLSSNKLEIHLRTGNQYVYKNTDYTYIQADTDVVKMTFGGTDAELRAVLAHTESSATSTKGFTFTSDDTSKASVTASGNTCYITAKSAGTTFITISNTGASETVEVPVIISESSDSSTIPYITSASNVVTVIEGEYTTVPAVLKNASSADNSDWTWTSADTTVADAAVKTGATAMISGNAPGTTTLTVKNVNAPYTFKFIVICVDAASVEADPYIQTSTSILTIDTGSSATITAEMTGGSASDSLYFSWSIADSSVALLSSGTGSVYVRGLSAGLTYITVRNSKYDTAYAKTILVYVSDSSVSGCSISLNQSIVKLDPDDTGETVTVTATLVNGDDTDAEDFVWWTDDPKIAAIKSSAGTCVISATGTSGSTYVHVKHSKVLKEADIIVLVSRYSSFAFPSTSKTIKAGQVYFVSMQVPASSDDVTVSYSSDNKNVCIVTGTNATCMLEGLAAGTAVIDATLETNGTVTSTCSLAVVCTASSTTDPVISFGSSMITLAVGSSQLVTASITGKSLPDDAKYCLKWHVQNSADGLTLLSTDTGGGTSGSSAYITAVSAGEYVLTCEYTDGTSADVMVEVPEDKQILISLDETSLSMSKDDGSVKITATLTNASDSDYSTISWTATKQGGVNIVSVTKAKGETCAIVPRNSGSTTVRASLPDGTYADCFVTVTSPASLSFSCGAIHVTPGYSETVSYTVYPEAADISFYDEQNSTSSTIGSTTTYFNYVVNTADKTVTITALKNAGGKAGTLSGIITSSSAGKTATLTVYTEYDPELSLGGSSSLVLLNPDSNETVTAGKSLYVKTGDKQYTQRTFSYTCYPADMTLSYVISNPDVLKVSQITGATSFVDGRTIKTGTITLNPTGEADNVTVTFTGTTTGDNGTSVSKTAVKYVSMHYTNYTILPDWTELQEGAFTYYDANANTLHLGDGEGIVFTAHVQEENADGSNLTILYSPSGTYSDDNLLYTSKAGTDTQGVSYGDPRTMCSTTGDILIDKEQTTSDGGVSYKILHNTDHTEQTMYLIDRDLYYDFYKITYVTETTENKNGNTTETIVSHDFSQKAASFPGSDPQHGFTNWYVGSRRWGNDWNKYTCNWGYLNFNSYSYDDFNIGEYSDCYGGSAGTYYSGGDVKVTTNSSILAFSTAYDGKLVVSYVPVTPYCISETDFMNNRNYYRGKLVGTHGAQGGGFEWDDDDSTSGPTVLHKYATQVTTVDSSIASTAHGTITVRYKKYDNTYITKNFSVNIDSRECTSYGSGWTASTDSYGVQRWYKK